MADPSNGVSSAESQAFCLCQRQDGGLMIECSRGTGGCNGWVHPRCCGLILRQDELEDLESYICPACETMEDAMSSKSMTTKKANDTALSNRQPSTASNSSSRASATSNDEGPRRSLAGAEGGRSGRSSEERLRRLKKLADVKEGGNDGADVWICPVCTFDNAAEDSRCVMCGEMSTLSTARSKKRKKPSSTQAREDASLGEVRRSRRGVDHVSYHIPESDEDVGSTSDSGGEPKKEKREKNRTADVAEPTNGDTDFAVPETLIIEKILGKRQAESEPGSKDTDTEYLIKWKGWSYIHVSWEKEDTLINLDPQNRLKIRRFLDKEPDRLGGGDEELFNPDFCQVDRILAETEEQVVEEDEESFVDMKGNVRRDDGMRYLVKWQSLPYSDCTWERGCDIDDDAAIAAYRARVKLPPEEEVKSRPHPELREYRKVAESPKFGAEKSLTLREYQLEGMNWLIWNWFNKRASILADEMGLGKTIQTMAFVNYLWKDEKRRIRGPFLVVAPLSLIAQWQQECETWTEMNCVVYHGTSAAREVIQKYEFYYLDPKTKKPDRKKPLKFHMLVTTYEVAIKDIRLLSRIKWRCLIVDEAHRLKNQSSRLSEQLRSIHRDHCVLLTGTPLQNNTEELWALLHFIDAESFPALGKFLEEFGDLQDSNQVAKLHTMLKPYLLRRVKEDVEKSLPPKEETIIEVELTAVQKQWYKAIYERNTAFLFRGVTSGNMPSLMNVVMELRKCCNHPYLINSVEDTVTQGLTNPEELHEMMVKCSGKMVLLDKLLPRLKENGHKVLIFSQMVRVLDILEDYLRFMQYGYERLDGNIRGNERQAAIDRFVKPSYDRYVMLLSTKAGGLGLNLTAADTVIIFDSDWNPQNDLQAQARAHRIGQTHAVKIYRLVTKSTYEMHMFHRASLKLGLDQAVLQHMRNENEREAEGGEGGIRKKKALSQKAKEAAEIDELLKRGAYDVFRDDDTAAEQFCAADIDQILARSSQIVTYEQQARSTFSKASFVAADTSEELDIDDPDFWRKAVGMAEPEMVEDDDVLPSQRKRTRVQRYGELEDELAFEDDEELQEALEGMDKEEEESESEDAMEEDQIDGTSPEPREWTINARDRCQRALMQLGFGRWVLIRRQCGGSRTVEDVETFGRSFVLQCGICAQESQGKDSPFIREAIEAAQKVAPLFESGGQVLPAVLTEPEFEARLKQGTARRVLNRLDVLLRLHRMIATSCETLEKKSGIQVSNGVYLGDHDRSDPAKSVSLDERTRRFKSTEIACSLPILDVGRKPAWTKLTEWWTPECDRHLIVGVFKHGYGRFAQMAADPELCFRRLLLEYSMKVTSVSGSPNSPMGGDTVLSGAVSGSIAQRPMEDESGEQGPPTQEEDPLEGGHVPSHDPLPVDCKMPDSQQLNRLLMWILSAEDILRRREEELQRQERLEVWQSQDTKIAKRMREADAMYGAGMGSKAAVNVPAVEAAFVQAAARQFNQPDGAVADPDDRAPWTPEERRVFCYTVAAFGAPYVDDSVRWGRHQFRPDMFGWKEFIDKSGFDKAAAALDAYFHNRFVPKCLQVAAWNGEVGEGKADSASPGVEFVDPDRPLEAHTFRARRIAFMCIKRIRFISACRLLVSVDHDKLAEFVRSPAGRDVSGLPLWWCPWLHDYKLLCSLAKHGLGAWKVIYRDPELPFNSFSIRKLASVLFLGGRGGKEPTLPVVARRFCNAQQCALWLQRTLSSFPDEKFLEWRAHTLLSQLTASLPDSSLYKVEPPSKPVRWVNVTNFGLPDSAEATEPVAENGGIDGQTSNAHELSQLQAFMETSAERRTAYLKEAARVRAQTVKSSLLRAVGKKIGRRRRRRTGKVENATQLV